MSVKICLSAATLGYLQGAGHVWMLLNWALGLRALGCNLIWLEPAHDTWSAEQLRAEVTTLKSYLEPFGLADSLALYSPGGKDLTAAEASAECVDVEAATDADLLLNIHYSLPDQIAVRFRRSALVDIDPGRLQTWIAGGYTVAPHDVYFTIGEAVAYSGTLIPSCGLRWQYTPPPVFLPAWPPTKADNGSHYTTITHWGGKQKTFRDYLDLPLRTSVPLELAVGVARNEQGDEEMRALERLGWYVQHAWDTCSTTKRYRSYIQNSRGEFSCARQDYITMQTAWLSDRTVCYLASGKPAIVQHTGPSRLLPDAEGMFRFRTPNEAVQALQAAESDYERHSRNARALAEEFFDAQKVVGRVLERALA